MCTFMLILKPENSRRVTIIIWFKAEDQQSIWPHYRSEGYQQGVWFFGIVDIE